jgi:putative oxidoreductase
MATAAATDHRGKGFFVFKGGWEYTAVVALAATALAGLGNGRWSVDRLFGRKQRSGAAMAISAAALGLAGAGALLATSYRPPSKDESADAEPSPEAADADLA